MSYSSPRKRRNGKLLSQESLNRTDVLPRGILTSNMENVDANANEQSRTRSPSPSIRDETQRENEERFKRLQNEMSSLKAMMERLLEQNSEGVRKVDTAPTPCSFGVHVSNTRSYFRYA